MTTFTTPLKAGIKELNALGDVVLMQQGTVTYQNTTAKVLFTIPRPYRILDILTDVTTAFNSSGTDLLDIGRTGSANRFADDIDVSSTGRKAVQAAKLANFAEPTDDGGVDIITATFAQSVADASAGAASIVIVYAVTKTLPD